MQKIQFNLITYLFQSSQSLFIQINKIIYILHYKSSFLNILIDLYLIFLSTTAVFFSCGIFLNNYIGNNFPVKKKNVFTKLYLIKFQQTFLGRNTEGSCISHFRGSFLMQRLNWHFLHWLADHQLQLGSPLKVYTSLFYQAFVFWHLIFFFFGKYT